ncbi:MAG: CrcB family protein, partial [Bacteroidia bacterium]
QLSNSLRLMILTGFCGGLSTFSTFSYETATLFKQGDAFWAILNIAISVILCVGILFIAYKKAI